MSVFARLLGELVTCARGRRRAEDAEPGARDAAAVNALVEQYLELARRGDLDNAWHCHHRLLDLAPLYARGRNNLGIVHQRRASSGAPRAATRR
jgi:hypothetical protein